MKTCYQTDPGKVRSHNEDSVTIIKNMSDEYLLVVADGMGGHKAGEVASSLVVTELGKRFAELSSIGTKEEAVIWLKEIIDEVNIKILKYSEEHIDASGLGYKKYTYQELTSYTVIDMSSYYSANCKN